jgi:putative addiction module killer protein
MKITVDKTEHFLKWLTKLKDRHAKAIITNHADRMESGNFGNVKSVGDGVFEKKIDYGPGYRLYYCQTGETIILLLCGGDKSNQQADINQAKEIRKELYE